MVKEFDKLTENGNDMKSLIQTFNETLNNIEKRLSRLEKMDSIEHRVEVNQIDLSDIKESLQRIEDSHNSEIKHINRRLDSHLVKIAKVEEEMIIIKTKE
jgi:predicted  nucleic acid-binding Zn-ribbon protein